MSVSDAKYVVSVDFGSDAVVCAISAIDSPTKVDLVVDAVSSKRFTAPVVAFKGNERLAGELACTQPASNAKNVVKDLVLLCAAEADGDAAPSAAEFSAFDIVDGEGASVRYNGEQRVFSAWKVGFGYWG